MNVKVQGKKNQTICTVAAKGCLNLHKNIKFRLRCILSEKNINVRKLCKLLNINYLEAVILIYSPLSTIKLTTALNLCKGLKISIRDLIV